MIAKKWLVGAVALGLLTGGTSAVMAAGKGKGAGKGKAGENHGKAGEDHPDDEDDNNEN